MERLARRATLVGSIIWIMVFFPALMVGLKNVEARSGFTRLFWSERVALPGFASFFVMMKLMWKPLPVQPPARLRSPLAAVGLLSFVIGLMLAIWGRIALGRMFGVSSAVEAPLHIDHELVTSGPYALTRHPVYLGDALLSFGLLAIWRNWASVFLSFMAPSLIFRAQREEETLARGFGSKWNAYAARVPMIFPKLSQILPTLWEHISK